MADKQETVIIEIPAHPMNKPALCLFVKVDHDIAAKDNVKFALERVRLVHKVEPAKNS